MSRLISSSLSSKVWNPYSLLHIPMYGVLMILLVLSFGTNPTVLRIISPISPSFFFQGGITSVVGILDEIHQIYIPGRDASAMDVMLDILGIVLFGNLMYFIVTGFHQSNFYLQKAGC